MSVMYKPDVRSRVHTAVQSVGPVVNKDTSTDKHIERVGAPLSRLASGEIQLSLLIAMPNHLGLPSASRKLQLEKAEDWQLRECAIGSCNVPMRSQ